MYPLINEIIGIHQYTVDKHPTTRSMVIPDDPKFLKILIILLNFSIHGSCNLIKLPFPLSDWQRLAKKRTNHLNMISIGRITRLISPYHTTAALYKRVIDYSRVPVLREDELQETFVRGSGPGGQSVNKTSNACVLKHLPTGIIVKCHIHRQVTKNQKEARLILINKLDNLINKEMSVENQQREIDGEKTSKQNQKRRKLQELKDRWKEDNKQPQGD